MFKVSVLWGEGSFGKRWAITLGGTIIRNANHEKIMMASHGEGFN